jgi:hypothetical protein
MPDYFPFINEYRGEPLPPLDCALFELTEAGAAHWRALDGWTLDESALLLSGANPMRVYEFAKDPDMVKPDYTTQGYPGTLLRLQRAAEMGVLEFPAPGADICKWAATKQGLPAPLSQLLGEVPTLQADAVAAPVAAPVVASWSLTKPRRFQGYTEPLYLLLEAAQLAGQPRPTARDVLQAFGANQPSQIAKVTGGESLDYYLTKGGTKTANLKAITAAITGMTAKSQD